jgi:exodeoxyribonuclease VII large subunit
MVVSRKDDFCSRIDRLAHRVNTAMSGRVHRLESRLRMLEARPGLAGAQGRILMRSRHAAELSHELRHVLRVAVEAHGRRWQLLRQKLEAFDLRTRLGGIRTRLVTADGRLATAAARRQHAADARLRTAAARLESLSPLRVLGRGYAVAFAADGRVIRDAGSLRAGDRVAVRVERGQLDCTVNDTKTDV